MQVSEFRQGIWLVTEPVPKECLSLTNYNKQVLVESEHVPLNNKVRKFSLMFVVLGPTCGKTYSNERKCK